MTTRHPLCAIALAMAAALPLVASAQLQAQTTSNWRTTRIDSVVVEPVEFLRGGEALAFTVQATPGAVVTLDIEGGARGVPLTEVQPGLYQGDYVIRRSDRLSANSRVTARAVRDGRTSVAMLGSSLLVGGQGAASSGAGQITDFAIDAPDRVRPGDELRFSLTGQPGGKARVVLTGVPRPIALTESGSGVYEGSYVVRRNQPLGANLLATAYLEQGGQTSSQRFERGTATNGARAGAVQQTCVACGAVQSVELVTLDGNSSNAAGTIAGGVIGGVIGNQVGNGRGKDLARIAGVIGGAYAGNRVQNRMDKNQVYRVAVRLDNGDTRNFDYPDDPAVAVGTRVRVQDDQLIRL